MIKSIFYIWIPLACLSVFTYIMQSHLYLHKDVAIITHTAAAMLAGETYTKNILEPNPPLIFYLSMPAIILAKLASISTPSAIRIYFIGLIFISLSISYFLIKKLVGKNTVLIYSLFYVMSYVLLFLPAQQFAQREHFLLVLILPYLFASALSLENKTVPVILRIAIGLMAGIGFAIKPHFFPALLLIEAYFIYQKRSILGWVRVESLCIFSVFLAYFCVILLFYRMYLFDVLPLWMPYYSALVHPVSTLLLHPGFIYCIAILVFYFITRRLNQYKTISAILSLAMIGFICTYLFPRVAWYYHLLPALGMACLLVTLIFWQYAEKYATRQSLAGNGCHPAPAPGAARDDRYSHAQDPVSFKISPIFLKKKMRDIVLLIAMAGILYFIPLTLSIYYFSTAQANFNANSRLSHLIQFFKKQPNETTFDLFSVTHDNIVLEFYTPTQYVGTFPFFMWEYNQVLLKYSPSAANKAYEQKYIPFFIQKIVDDLNTKKPTFIIVDVPSSLDYLGIKINYIEKYSKYKIFKNAWQNYYFLTWVDGYAIYKRR